jgi:hypothetical protein
VGFPIRRSPGQRQFAPLRSLSQLIASFFAGRCQGIPRVPLFTSNFTFGLSGGFATRLASFRASRFQQQKPINQPCSVSKLCKKLKVRIRSFVKRTSLGSSRRFQSWPSMLVLTRNMVRLRKIASRAMAGVPWPPDTAMLVGEGNRREQEEGRTVS